MIFSIHEVIVAVYYCTLGILAFYGLHRLHLLVLYYRTRNQHPVHPGEPSEWPKVTVQLPIFNELYVARRLVEAVSRIDYPRDRLEIQVLDDSTDETVDVVAEVVERLRAEGHDIQHLHRTDRTGFKAGALAAGMLQAKGEFLAVFDADFVPTREFLKQTVPYFQNQQIGMVQARWGHLNRDYSLLTRIQAMFLDAHFLIEHQARNRSGRFFNFNGTAGVWRRQAIEDGGGWQHDTLTEDLDLSYRSQLAGWQFLFLSDVTVPAELPVEVHAFRRQQFRWAKGSIQTARKLLVTILRSSIPWKAKIEAMIHLTNNTSYVLMVLLSLLIFPAMMLRRGTDLGIILTVDLPLFLGATLSVLAFYIASQAALGTGWKKQIKRLPPLMGLGIGLSLNNARAALEGVFQKGGVFERTPKYGIEEDPTAGSSTELLAAPAQRSPVPQKQASQKQDSERHDWATKKYRANRTNRTMLLEGVFAAYFTACFFASVRFGMWASLPFLYLFLQGYSYMFLLSWLSTKSAQRFGDAVSVAATTKRSEG